MPTKVHCSSSKEEIPIAKHVIVYEYITFNTDIYNNATECALQQKL